MKKGTIKVSGVYPNGDEKGLSGAIPGSPYLGMGNMYFDSLQDFENAFGPHALKIMAICQISRTTIP